MKLLIKYYPYLTGSLVFVVYLFTSAPSVVQIDSGELAAVQSTLGIAHPTGYPLFTLAGYLLSKLLFPFREIVALNLLSAIYCSISVLFFLKTLDYIFSNYQPTNSPQKNTTKKKKQFENELKEVKVDSLYIKITAVIFGGFILAFSTTFWLQSTSVEVYAMHVMLLMLIIYKLIRILFMQTVELKHWFVFAVLLALGFTNHMTTLLIIPSAAYVFFSKEKFCKQSVIKILKMLGVFFPLLFLVYSYLPIRSSMSPLLNWGNPVTFENFTRHVTGKQYQVWLFSSFDSASKQFGYFVDNLSSEFNVVILVLAFVGIVLGLKYLRSVSVFFLISLVFTVAYSINYDINDIDSYFLLAYISIAFFATLGSYYLLQSLPSKKNGLVPALFVTAFLTGFHIYNNVDKADQSDKHIFEDYTKALINSTEENSIIFSYQWDYFLSASYYFQHVEKYRSDVQIIDKELLRRSWYYNQLATNYPELFNGLENYVNQFLAAVKPFEQGKQFDANKLEQLYRKIMTGIVSNNIEEQNFYIGPELYDNEMKRGEFSLPDGYTIVPHLFLFKVVRGNDYISAPAPDFQFRLPLHPNKYTKFIEQMTINMLTYRAAYELQFGYKDKAKLYIEKARLIRPGIKLPAIFNSIN